jgi:hypothetical protein
MPLNSLPVTKSFAVTPLGCTKSFWLDSFRIGHDFQPSNDFIGSLRGQASQFFLSPRQIEQKVCLIIVAKYPEALVVRIKK